MGVRRDDRLIGLTRQLVALMLLVIGLWLSRPAGSARAAVWLSGPYDPAAPIDVELGVPASGVRAWLASRPSAIASASREMRWTGYVSPLRPAPDWGLAWLAVGGSVFALLAAWLACVLLRRARPLRGPPGAV